MSSRLAYRARQFWNVLVGPRVEVELEDVRPYLSPSLITLFCHMRPAEQAHGYEIFLKLRAGGYDAPDLLAAALLHDVGKLLQPPSLVERVAVVVGRRLAPRSAERWSEGRPAGLRRPFVLAAKHAEWGADLARKAGASEHTVELIRRHHDPSPDDDPELAALQRVDDAN